MISPHTTFTHHHHQSLAKQYQKRRSLPSYGEAFSDEEAEDGTDRQGGKTKGKDEGKSKGKGGRKRRRRGHGRGDGYDGLGAGDEVGDGDGAGGYWDENGNWVSFEGTCRSITSTQMVQTRL